MTVDTKEWKLLKHQFDELVHDESAAADNILHVPSPRWSRHLALATLQ